LAFFCFFFFFFFFSISLTFSVALCFSFFIQYQPCPSQKRKVQSHIVKGVLERKACGRPQSPRESLLRVVHRNLGRLWRAPVNDTPNCVDQSVAEVSVT
jgi:hypothetical protein